MGTRISEVVYLLGRGGGRNCEGDNLLRCANPASLRYAGMPPLAGGKGIARWIIFRGGVFWGANPASLRYAGMPPWRGAKELRGG
jgi:hypothetical protein